MEEYMQDDARRPLCDVVHCCAPTEVPYQIDASYTIARSKSKVAITIQNAVDEAVEGFKEWQRKMGRDVDPAELIARIKTAGAKRVTIASPSDITISGTQVPKLTAFSLVYGGLEDD
jgi:phage-related baseplate assembly protein